MFERYTERARRVIFFARYEASQFGSTSIDTEHFLLGMLREDPNVIKRHTANQVTEKAVADDLVSRLTVREKVSVSLDLPLSNECRRILACAAEEAERLNHRYIGVEHLLLGVLREEKCVAAQVLSRHGLKLEVMRHNLAKNAIPTDQEEPTTKRLTMQIRDALGNVREQQHARGEFIDLSHTIEHGMITYKGLPAPLICDFLSREASKPHYAEGTSFHIGKIEMVANTGTYLDSPFHRYATGKDLADLPLNSLANLRGIVFDAPADARAIPHDLFGSEDLAGKAVLIHTGWSKHWGTDQDFEDHPFLTRAAAEHLRNAGAALVGIDSYNIDDITDGTRPVHSVLLAADIPIVEHMRNLDQLPKLRGFTFFAVPPKVKAFGTFPVRAFAMV
jgi:kynurenine formamidase